MSILPDREIERHITINPRVSTQQRGGIFSWGPGPFGYDVRLAPLLYAIDRPLVGHPDGYRGLIDPKRFGDYNLTPLTVGSGGAAVVPPNTVVLGHSVEWLELPRDVSAVCFGKSSLARCGIHTLTTPLEAGWSGQITIEIANLNPLPVLLYVNEGIMQVQFFRGEPPRLSYADLGGRYMGQSGVTLPSVAGA